MPMNFLHRKLCASKAWADGVAESLPRSLDGFDLGDDVLEVGPGFGATTSVLAEGGHSLTALEVDEASAELLEQKFRGRAEIVHGDGAAMPFEDGRFSAVVCFTMMHHVPTKALQDTIFAEAHRVLRPGGLLRGTDSQLSLGFRLLHVGDIMNVLDHSTLPDRLARAGFRDVHVSREPGRVIEFSARK
ncbi:methyltransferase domain-containing protein [Amycolatopsis acidicola]|uniref:Methyltransferase domain-containing protein n=1 Tax=Amycolatopsis acidicola TaxID=2596893 RepID=A0A5N0V6W2_9PSEU|nr:class I SAM-dependent methyltransferase [Amycolatopsis acidicola]KAA9162097.1 methyltransferase domain-containing protein [Amycolatopsis acidicola]